MEPINLFNKGELAPSIKSGWIYTFRLEILNRVTIYAKNIANEYVLEEEWEMVEIIGSQLLSWNKYDDDGMRLAVLGNKKLEKNAMAHKIYLDFINDYKNEIGETYPISYDNVILNQIKGDT